MISTLSYCCLEIFWCSKLSDVSPMPLGENQLVSAVLALDSNGSPLLSNNTRLSTIMEKTFSHFSFTTSERELDYYHQKMNIRIAEQLKASDPRKLGNFKEAHEMLGINTKVLSRLTKSKF